MDEIFVETLQIHMNCIKQRKDFTNPLIWSQDSLELNGAKNVNAALLKKEERIRIKKEPTLWCVRQKLYGIESGDSSPTVSDG